MIVSLAGDSLQGKPKSTPRLRSFPPSSLRAKSTMMALPGSIASSWRASVSAPPHRLRCGAQPGPCRTRPLARRQKLAEIGATVAPTKPQMLAQLRQRETCVWLKRFPASSMPCTCRTSREAAYLVFTSARSARHWQACRHPPRGHFHAGAVEARARADAGARGQRPDPAAPGHVDVGSPARTGSLKHVILCGDTVLRLLLLGAPRPGEAATGPYRAAVPRARAPPECALVARLRQRAAGLGPYG